MSGDSRRKKANKERELKKEVELLGKEYKLLKRVVLLRRTDYESKSKDRGVHPVVFPPPAQNHKIQNKPPLDPNSLDYKIEKLTSENARLQQELSFFFKKISNLQEPAVEPLVEIVSETEGAIAQLQEKHAKQASDAQAEKERKFNEKDLKDLNATLALKDACIEKLKKTQELQVNELNEKMCTLQTEINDLRGLRDALSQKITQVQSENQAKAFAKRDSENKKLTAELSDLTKHHERLVARLQGEHSSQVESLNAEARNTLARERTVKQERVERLQHLLSQKKLALKSLRVDAHSSYIQSLSLIKQLNTFKIQNDELKLKNDELALENKQLESKQPSRGLLILGAIVAILGNVITLIAAGISYLVQSKRREQFARAQPLDKGQQDRKEQDQENVVPLIFVPRGGNFIKFCRTIGTEGLPHYEVQTDISGTKTERLTPC